MNDWSYACLAKALGTAIAEGMKPDRSGRAWNGQRSAPLSEPEGAVVSRHQSAHFCGDHITSISGILIHFGPCPNRIPASRRGLASSTNLSSATRWFPKGDVAENGKYSGRQPSQPMERVMVILPSINRRQLMTATATIAVAGLAPNPTPAEGLANSAVAQPTEPLVPPAVVQAGATSIPPHILRLQNCPKESHSTRSRIAAFIGTEGASPRPVLWTQFALTACFMLLFPRRNAFGAGCVARFSQSATGHCRVRRTSARQRGRRR